MNAQQQWAAIVFLAVVIGTGFGYWWVRTKPDRDIAGHVDTALTDPAYAPYTGSGDNITSRVPNDDEAAEGGVTPAERERIRARVTREAERSDPSHPDHYDWIVTRHKPCCDPWTCQHAHVSATHCAHDGAVWPCETSGRLNQSREED